MYYRVKNYVSLNKTSLTHRAHSICLGTDINKCMVNNGGCSHYCKNWGSSYVCTCPAGYEVDSSDKNCIGNKMTVFNNSIFGSRFVYFISSSCCISTLPADCSSSSSILAYRRKVLHESSKIFSEHSLHFARKQSRTRAYIRGTQREILRKRRKNNKKAWIKFSETILRILGDCWKKLSVPHSQQDWWKSSQPATLQPATWLTGKFHRA